MPAFDQLASWPAALAATGVTDAHATIADAGDVGLVQPWASVTKMVTAYGVLRLVEAFGRHDGTDIPSAVRAHFAGHDRVVVVTDEQTRAGWLPSNAENHGGMPPTEIDALVPRDVPVYMWNMAGYAAGAAPAGSANRHTFGGLTDHAFRLIPLLESGRSADWPWQ